jgi:hypothetical protein
MTRKLLTIFGLVGVLALVGAVSAIWLVLQEPVMVADAVSSGQYHPLLVALSQQVGYWFRTLATLL